MVKQVTNLAGQIRGMRSRICQDRWVSDLAGRAGDFGGGMRFWLYWSFDLKFDFDVLAFESYGVMGDVSRCRCAEDAAGCDIKDGVGPIDPYYRRA